MLQAFGDALLVHHCLSDQPFSKDKFEYVLVEVARACGRASSRAPKTNPGLDITMDECRFSLKTQANATIQSDAIWISKFMELGKGKWGDDPADLKGLLEQYLAHLHAYDRIVSLRTLSRPPANWLYELVEIPKTLLEQAQSGVLEMDSDSSQLPKPGHCYVYDSFDELSYQLYFDGGGERKLQIQHLQKALCLVHATWQFPPLSRSGAE
jgi:type II restriction enzyme